MGIFNFNEFRAKLRGDGARPHAFRVILTPPVFVALDSSTWSFMCKSTQSPGGSIGTVEPRYFGRPIHLAGERLIQPWSCQVFNDEPFDMYAAMERWQNAMDQSSRRAGNQRGRGATSSPNSYTGSATIEQYGKDGSLIRSWRLANVWPSDLSGLDLSWDASDQIQEFSVNFNLDWYESTTDVSTN